jgi:phage shock protein A
MTETIEVNLADILNKIDQRLDLIEQSVNDLKVNSVRLEGKVEAINAKIDSLDKRIGN